MPYNGHAFAAMMLAKSPPHARQGRHPAPTACCMRNIMIETRRRVMRGAMAMPPGARPAARDDAARRRNVAGGTHASFLSRMRAAAERDRALEDAFRAASGSAIFGSAGRAEFCFDGAGDFRFSRPRRYSHTSARCRTHGRRGGRATRIFRAAYFPASRPRRTNFGRAATISRQIIFSIIAVAPLIDLPRTIVCRDL